MNITYADGGKGTATVETGKLGPQAGRVLVLRRGFPVAAELAAGLPLAIVSPSMLTGVGLSVHDVTPVLDMVADWAATEED